MNLEENINPMLNKSFRLGLMSVLLTTTILSAETQNCSLGACFAKLDNLKPSKSSKEVKQNATLIMKPRYIVENIEVSMVDTAVDTAMTIILDGEETIVFPAERYVMTEAEKLNFLENERAKEDLLLLAQAEKKTEEKILEKSTLPTSDYFCKNKKKVVIDASEHTFQCV